MALFCIFIFAAVAVGFTTPEQLTECDNSQGACDAAEEHSILFLQSKLLRESNADELSISIDKGKAESTESQSLETAAKAVDACDDKTEAPVAEWVVYDLKKTNVDQACQGFSFGEKAPDECCEMPGGFNFLGSNFSSLYKDQGTCPGLFGGALHALMVCNEDNSITYGEHCSDTCDCHAVMNMGQGCYKATDLPGTLWFVASQGCSCTEPLHPAALQEEATTAKSESKAEQKTVRKAVDACDDKTEAPVAEWVVYDLKKTNVDQACQGFSFGEKAPDECCEMPGGFNFLGSNFSSLYKDQGTCPGLFGGALHALMVCNEDNSITYGEHCSDTCDCHAIMNMGQGCYKATDLPGTLWFVASQGCSCTEPLHPAALQEEATTAKSDSETEQKVVHKAVDACDDKTEAPVAEWVVYDLKKTNVNQACQGFSFGEKAPDECCEMPGGFNFLGSNFSSLYKDQGTCPGLFGGALHALMVCNEDNSITYGEHCSDTCDCHAVMNMGQGCYKATDLPGTLWFVASQGCSCTEPLHPAALQEEATTAKSDSETEQKVVHKAVDACEDKTEAPVAEWVVYDLKKTNVDQACQGFSFGEKAPDECCEMPGGFNFLGSNFSSLYKDQGTCPGLFGGALHALMVCNEDNSITYGEHCSDTCDCHAVMNMGQGCYKATDLPGTLWFVASQGCSCTEPLHPAALQEEATTAKSDSETEQKVVHKAVDACEDKTEAPVAEWVVYDLKKTNVDQACQGFSFGEKAPDECCEMPGGFNFLGSNFSSLYKDQGTCPGLFGGALHALMVCNEDNSITYGEHCSDTCDCHAVMNMGQGCYKATDLPGTLWFVASQGCSCTEPLHPAALQEEVTTAKSESKAEQKTVRKAVDACDDKTEAPVAEWVVYDLKKTNVNQACQGFSFGEKAPDECCEMPGGFNFLGSNFSSLYKDQGTCPGLFGGALHALMVCNEDNSITYGEHCSDTCDCHAVMNMGQGCYKATDLPGTLWFVASQGCSCE